LQQARNLHLAAQGLLVPARARARRAHVLAAIERMRLLQIDTIHVVARSPYLVLFSRLGDYEPRWLDELLARAEIFECWAHEACFAPMQDLALHRHEHELRGNHFSQRGARRTRAAHGASIDSLIAHIRARGPVKSSDFERKDKGVSGWWEWKDEKRWLEAAFALGELMVARRENFQRVYDIAERVLERMKIDAVPRLSAEAVRREYILGAVRALGVTQARWIGDYFRTGRRIKDAELNAFVAANELLRVEVRGWDAPAYVHPDHVALLDRARRGNLRATHTTLLSPFDPMVWDRERASAMFAFDYRLECYTPAPKRRFGYFVLPILQRGRLVGRLDAKAHRADGVFEIRSIYLEDDVDAADEAMTRDIAGAIKRVADWHGTPRVIVRKSAPKAWARGLREMLQADD
jgi:uncharacterized protein YcaQ